ncbi:MAG TPA: MFS transporter [Candidatus Lokiarchaeia archaeon]|nr:MFS transporter [Candidatus Lokiarchaeia archaeon]
MVEEPSPEKAEEPVRHASQWRLTWFVALLILSLGTSNYSDTESQWFTSYVNNVGSGNSLQIGIAMGTMIALRFIVGMIFYLIWGTIGDNVRPKRLGNRVVMILTGCSVTAILMLIYITTTNLVLLVIIAGIFLAASSNMVHVNNRALIADLTPDERRGKTNTFITIFGTVGSLLVWIPAAALLPSGRAGFTWSAHATMITIAAAIIGGTGISTLLLVRHPPTPGPARSWTVDLKSISNLSEMRQYNGFFRLFVAKIFSTSATNAYYPFFLSVLQFVNWNIPTMVSAIPLVGIPVGLGYFFASKYTDILGRKRVTMICLYLAPIGGIFISLLGANTYLLLVGLGIMMPFTTAVGIATDSWTLDLFPPGSRGRFAGILNIGNGSASALVAFIAGVIKGLFGMFWIFTVFGVVLWLAIPFFRRVPEPFVPKRKRKQVVEIEAA